MVVTGSEHCLSLYIFFQLLHTVRLDYHGMSVELWKLLWGISIALKAPSVS